MKVYGSAGAHASKLMAAAGRRAALGVLVSVASFGVFLFNGAFAALGGEGLVSVLAILSLVGIGGGVLVAYEAGQRWSKARIGMRSEQQVGRVLDSSGAAVVVHGALLGAGGDADHVVLGPIVAVVETKTGHGEVRSDEKGLFVGQRRILGDPLRQAQRQAVALKKLSGAWTEAVVCIPGMRNAPFKTSRGWVCSLQDLPKVLSSLPRTMSAQDAERLAGRILPEE